VDQIELNYNSLETLFTRRHTTIWRYVRFISYYLEKDMHKRTCPWSWITTLWPLIYMRHTQGDKKATRIGTFMHNSWHHVVSQLRFIVLAALGKSNILPMQINMHACISTIMDLDSYYTSLLCVGKRNMDPRRGAIVF